MKYLELDFNEVSTITSAISRAIGAIEARVELDIATNAEQGILNDLHGVMRNVFDIDLHPVRAENPAKKEESK